MFYSRNDARGKDLPASDLHDGDGDDDGEGAAGGTTMDTP